MSVRDLRNAGWCWQEKAALDVLRVYYDGERLKRRATALAIYLVLTEIASDQHDRSTAETTHRIIWERTGTSETTVKQYLREMVAIGLLQVEHREAAPKLNLPNVYHLLTPGGGAVDSPTGAAEHDRPGATDGPGGAANGHHPEERSLKNGSEEEDMSDDQFVKEVGAGLSAAVRSQLKSDHTKRGTLDRLAYAKAVEAVHARQALRPSGLGRR